MRILGLDTATAVASVALVENGVVVAQEAADGTSRAGSGVHAGKHATVLLPLIDTVLHRCGVALNDLSALAVSIGPGSFTGLRIGLSAVKGIAYGSETAVVGVSTLRALARGAGAWDGVVCPLLDARKNEVYAALFENSAGRLTRLMPDAVAPLHDFLHRAERIAGSRPYLFAGEGAEAYRAVLVETLGMRAHLAEAAAALSVGAAVALVGAEKFERGKVTSARELAPVYIRPSDAEYKVAKFR
ncbi:MAG TPA: tRNA (adenosine(37)-N6)-threonylcarbamoyltransferase complex dimerization subunit type 1 TsaB [Candidatus Eisenbacteria bacterium]|nr:tRNA (adenosine(37)-N6)-threonylcarbamoyltransferase complex dimerization subunit type 1 TsaB [Candidatus Eisenbacteria bacterium]